ncbi:hypothetical protein IFR05_007201 [Cadophora sp. M221]|nr:hypothetical protein IFR05_007201 [Cadophora sp. M221]
MAGIARAADTLEMKSQPWRAVWPASKEFLSAMKKGEGNLNGQQGYDNEGKGVTALKKGEGNLNGQYGYDNEGKGVTATKKGEGNFNGQHGYNDKGEGISSQK